MACADTCLDSILYENKSAPHLFFSLFLLTLFSHDDAQYHNHLRMRKLKEGQPAHRQVSAPPPPLSLRSEH